MKKVLLTGCAGFIGFHVANRLLQLGYEVQGLDNLNLFYNEGLKDARLAILRKQTRFHFVHAELAKLAVIAELFQRNEFDAVVHLAAQAGVRYSLENPHLYIQSNVAGFVNLIEEARKKKLAHFVFASSSSVYGANRKIPFSEQDNVDHPISLYAATKKSDELIAHVYAHLYSLPVTGLRFFTVYGPWGRPDMAIFKFCKAIYEGTPIDVFNNGQMRRDFTYIDDIVEGVVRVLERPPAPGAEAGQEPDISPGVSPYYRIYNIGNNQPVELLKLIQVLEEKIGKKAVIRWLPIQPGDVPVTYADIDGLSREVGYRPHTPIEEGISRFVDWYREHYKVCLTSHEA
ncbi:MAG: NAD-dependent epimerase [Acidobacteriia bacterium]|nr:NAD-dependent epimerase [Terriglobia bacterium]